MTENHEELEISWGRTFMDLSVLQLKELDRAKQSTELVLRPPLQSRKPAPHVYFAGQSSEMLTMIWKEVDI